MPVRPPRRARAGHLLHGRATATAGAGSPSAPPAPAPPPSPAHALRWAAAQGGGSSWTTYGPSAFNLAGYLGCSLFLYKLTESSHADHKAETERRISESRAETERRISESKGNTDRLIQQDKVSTAQLVRLISDNLGARMQALECGGGGGGSTSGSAPRLGDGTGSTGAPPAT